MSDKKVFLNRRGFLQLSGLGLAAAVLAGCAPQAKAPVAEADYYTARQDQLLQAFDDNAPFWQLELLRRYPAAEVSLLLGEVRRAYAALIPQLPYLGGDQNLLTENLVQSAWCLAAYRALQARGCALAEAGQVIYGAASAMMCAYPRGVNRLVGLLQTSRSIKDGLRQAAAESQRRRYAGDWVFTFVEGDGQAFDWGLDYTECGICKFYRAQGAYELVPYLCVLDFPSSQATDAGLVRTTTLGMGGARCDFRYNYGGPTQPIFPPGLP